MRQVSNIRMMVFAVAVVAIATAAGCATAPLRTEGTTSGIRAAEEVGAAKVPQASLHLQLANEELEHAKQLAKKGEGEQARSMLLRAEADAELAVLLSREDGEKTESRAAVARVKELQTNNR